MPLELKFVKKSSRTKSQVLLVECNGCRPFLEGITSIFYELERNGCSKLQYKQSANRVRSGRELTEVAIQP